MLLNFGHVTLNLVRLRCPGVPGVQALPHRHFGHVTLNLIRLRCAGISRCTGLGATVIATRMLGESALRFAERGSTDASRAHFMPLLDVASQSPRESQ